MTSGLRMQGAREPVALVLGGTLPHRALIQNLQSRGYYVVLIDHLESPPAATICNRHVRESTLDEEAVLEWALALNAALVVSTCIDQANFVASKVAASLGLPIPYSLDTAERVTNKSLMKHRLVASGVPTSHFVSGTSWQDFENHGLKYPVVVKPNDANGSKGVVKVDTPRNLRASVDVALGLSRSHQAVVEEWVSGREIAIDSYILDGEAHILCSRERRKIRHTEPTTHVEQIVGSVWPAQVDDEVLQEYKRIAEVVAKSFHLENTPLMMQAILHEDGLSVIEFAPRIGGAENYRIIRLATGADVIDYAVDSWLGKRPALNYSAPSKVFADLYIYAHAAPFGEITGIADLVDRQVVLYGETYKRRGETVTADLTSNQRVGAIVACGPTENDVLDSIHRAANGIRVLDTSNQDIKRTAMHSRHF